MNFRLFQVVTFVFSAIALFPGAQAQSAALEPAGAAGTSVSPDAPGTVYAPQTTATGKVLSSAEGDYVLAPGDTIEMTIFREPDLTSQSSIARDGTVQLPLIKEVKLAGLTVRDARDLLRKLYDEKFLVNPQVYLSIVRFSQRKFTILGQVQKPGAYELEGGETLDLLEAIGMAGGFTPTADHGRILIKRKSGDNVGAPLDHSISEPTPKTAIPWYQKLPIIGLFHRHDALPETSKTSRFQAITANAKRMAAGQEEPIMILPGDVITVGESWY